LLWLAAGDDLGDNSGAKRFNAAAAAIPAATLQPYSWSGSATTPRKRIYICMYIYSIMAMPRHLDKGVAGTGRPPSLLVVATSSTRSL
jgi:hypothetical protein